MTTEQISQLLEDKPEWLVAERESYQNVLREERRLKALRAEAGAPESVLVRGMAEDGRVLLRETLRFAADGEAALAYLQARGVAVDLFDVGKDPDASLALFTRLGKASIGPHPKRQRLLLAQIAIVHAPVATARWRHQQEQSVAVGELIRFISTLGRLDCHYRKTHDGISNPVTGELPSKIPSL